MRAEPKVTKYQESETIALKSTNPNLLFFIERKRRIINSFLIRSLE